MKLYDSIKGDYNFVMAYPATEDIALSSLGYLWLYKIADSSEGINAIRISTDNFQMLPKSVDSIAFSMSFDFDYIGVLKILEQMNLPFFAKDRDETAPLIFAGGPVLTTNPCPYEEFFDFMIIGDGEEVFVKILDILKRNRTKSMALKELESLEGIYIKGKQTKLSSVSLNDVIYSPIISEQSYFKNTFIVEVARGCMNRCAFCTASYLNLPFRAYSYDKIIEAIELGLKYTNKIALLGAQISAHPEFSNIMSYLSNKISDGTDIELGISSLRTDAITPEIIQTLVKGGQRNSTIAIEAASERLRKFINKNLSEEQILKAVKISKENGLKGLKIYSMIGIPTETEEDIKEFLNLAKKIKTANKGLNIEFSFSTFVPKPQTPFQWLPREETKSLEKKQKFLEKELSKIGVKTKFSSPKWDYWQTVLSRSDSSIAQLLVYSYENGSNLASYKNGVKTLNIDITKSIHGYNQEESLPWDVIESNPSKQHLINEYNRLKKYINLK